MKKYLLLLLLPVLFAPACQKTEYVVPNRTILTQVKPGNWVTFDNGKTYSAGIDMPEIDTYFNERGAALVYISFGTVDYEQIPQVFSGISYRYTTKPGQITIVIESSDPAKPIDKRPTGPMDVKIVLIDSK